MGKFTKDEVCCLGKAPFAAFLVVSAADGRFQQKELLAFLDFIKSRGEGVICQAMATSQLKAQEVISELAADFGKALPLLEEASQIIDRRLSLKEAVQAKRTLLDAARVTARATGSGWLGLGTKVGHEEREALKEIAAALGL